MTTNTTKAVKRATGRGWWLYNPVWGAADKSGKPYPTKAAAVAVYNRLFTAAGTYQQ